MTRPQPTGGDVEALAVLLEQHMPRPGLNKCRCGAAYPYLGFPVHRAEVVAAYVQAARDEERSRIGDEVQRQAERHSNLRRTLYGPPSLSVTLNELDAIVREARGGAR